MKKIAITGPTGAIGIALINECITQGIEVYALCRKNSKRVNNIPDSELVHIVECDLSDIKRLSIDNEMKECDAF